MAARVAGQLGVASMLPVLAAMHLLCAALVGLLRPRSPDAREGSVAETARPPAPAWPDVRDPYLRSIAAVVGLGAVAGAVLDYLFKAQAVAAFGGGPPLMRLFAAFYTATGLLAFVIQVSLGRTSLERLGLAGTVAALPLGVAAGGMGMLLVPGIAGAGSARAAETVLRGSVYRLGYELLYTPVPPGKKRATKTIVDVALERLGELLGAGLVRLALLAPVPLAATALTQAVVVLGVVGFLASRRLHRGYVGALEQSLLSRAVELNLGDVVDRTTRTTVLRAVGQRPEEEPAVAPHRPPSLETAEEMESGLFLLRTALRTAPWTPLAVVDPMPAVGTARPARPRDPIVVRTADLRSGDPERVRKALRAPGGLEPLLAPHAIALLAWDEVAEDAIEALRPIAPRIAGQLVDALLDPAEEFAIRRRVPRVLRVPSPWAVDGLLRALADRRFEVRYECGRALSALRDGVPPIEVDAARVNAAVLGEAAVDERLWESQRLLEPPRERDESFPLDDFLRRRSGRSLEHVFRLLSLVLPKRPLLVAFRALHTDDAGLRGTALEYLASVLPPAVRERLWPFLEDDRPPERPSRTREEVLEELMRSDSSIELNLEALRRKASS